MPQVELGAVSVYYEETGEGPPLVLLAGLASDSASWAPLAPLLAPHFRLIMPDNRGAGRTRYGAAPVTIASMAADAAALLDHLKVGRAHILGHSMGALIAATLAASRPELVDRLILAGASAQRSARAAAVIADLAALRDTNASAELRYRLFFHWLFAPKFFEDPQAVAAAAAASAAYPYAPSDDAYRAQSHAASGFDAAILPRIAAPTLILSGELDLLAPWREAHDGFAVLPNARQVVLPGAAHSLHWDDPVAFARETISFLSAGAAPMAPSAAAKGNDLP